MEIVAGMTGKVCRNERCEKAGEVQAYSAYYVRSGVSEPKGDGDYLSDCKACMKRRNKEGRRLGALVPREASERLAIAYLVEKGIPALPGKAVGLADVDVAAWGCIRIEVKYSRNRGYGNGFIFALTKRQERAIRADVVMLICDYEDFCEFHLFRADDPVFFFSDGRRKRYFDWKPGRVEQKKHFSDRTVLTRGMMDAAQDNVALIEELRLSWRERWEAFLGSSRVEG